LVLQQHGFSFELLGVVYRNRVDKVVVSIYNVSVKYHRRSNSPLLIVGHRGKNRVTRRAAKFSGSALISPDPSAGVFSIVH
jgi:hypothetical protein